MNKQEYYQKYIKYKQKYFNLKNNQHIQAGGNNNKIFDLAKQYNYKKGKLQQNLKKFEKEYGNNFSIKYNNKIIDVTLKKIKLPNDTEFYRLTYDTPHRTNVLTPLIIDFIDMISAKTNNNSFLSTMHRTDIMSGSELVNICIEVNRILGAKKIFVGDSTKITCDKNNQKLDLSLLKLIEKR